jgi:hypothetical protein
MKSSRRTINIALRRRSEQSSPRRPSSQLRFALPPQILVALDRLARRRNDPPAHRRRPLTAAHAPTVATTSRARADNLTEHSAVTAHPVVASGAAATGSITSTECAKRYCSARGKQASPRAPGARSCGRGAAATARAALKRSSGVSEEHAGRVQRSSVCVVASIGLSSVTEMVVGGFVQPFVQGRGASTRQSCSGAASGRSTPRIRVVSRAIAQSAGPGDSSARTRGCRCQPRPPSVGIVGSTRCTRA